MYQIKSKMKKGGTVPEPASKAINPAMVEMIQDLRDEDKTTTEIASELGLTFDEVASVPARNASGDRSIRGKRGRPKSGFLNRPTTASVSLEDDDDDWSTSDASEGD